MRSKSSPGEASADATHAGALSEAVRRAHEDARSVVNAAHGIVTRAGQGQQAAGLDGEIDALRASVGRFEDATLALGVLLNAQQEQQRQHVVNLQRLKQRLTDTQTALRYSSAALVALETVHRLLRRQAEQVSDFTRISMLDSGRYQATHTAAWFEFIASGRLSPAVEVEQSLRDVGDEPLPPFTGLIPFNSADLSGIGGEKT